MVCLTDHLRRQHEELSKRVKDVHKFPRLNIRFSLSIEELIALGNYDKNTLPTELVPVESEMRVIGQKDITHTKIILLQFKESLPLGQMNELAQNLGYFIFMPHRFLLEVGAQYPELQRKHTIVQLGTQWKKRGSLNFVSCLSGDKKSRMLSTCGCEGYFGNVVFLALKG